MKIALKAGLDPTLPDVSLEIGGKVRQLAYDFAAIIEAEKQTGINLMQAASFSSNSFTQVRGLLYAALLKDDPKITLTDIDKFLNMRNLLLVQEAVATAWFGSIPAPKDHEAGEAPAQTETAQA